MPISIRLIAPCGLNCGLCGAYLRRIKPCPGCKAEDENKSASCINCVIKNCRVLAAHDYKFCFKCENIPCKKLTDLDKRYRTRYSVGVFENLESIKRDGIKQFVRDEKSRWSCTRCGGVICMHTAQCSRCGK